MLRLVRRTPPASKANRVPNKEKDEPSKTRDKSNGKKKSSNDASTTKKSRSWLRRRVQAPSKREDNFTGKMKEVSSDERPDFRTLDQLDPRDHALFDQDRSLVYDGTVVYDETLWGSERSSFLYRGSIDCSSSASDSSRLLEILSESTGKDSQPPSLTGVLKKGSRITIQHSFTRSQSTPEGVKTKGREKPLEAIDISETSDSSNTQSTSELSSSSRTTLDNQSGLMDGPREKSHSKNRAGCSQDIFLDCAEYSIEAIAKKFWVRKREAAGNQTMANTNIRTKTESKRDTPESSNAKSWFSVPVVEDDEDDGQLDSKASVEALRAMMGQALKEGSILATTTFDTIRRVATDMTEDPGASAGSPSADTDSHHPTNETARRVMVDSPLPENTSTEQSRPSSSISLDWPLDDPHPRIRSTSTRSREEAAWEAFQELRNHQQASHRDAQTRYWSTELEMPDDERRASSGMKDPSLSDSHAKGTPTDPNLDFHDFIYQSGTDLKGTSRKLGKEIDYAFHKISMLDRDSPESEHDPGFATEFLTAIRSDLSCGVEPIAKIPEEDGAVAHEVRVHRISSHGGHSAFSQTKI